MGAEGGEIFERRPPAGEDAALDGQARRFERLEYAKAANRVVAGQQHDLDLALGLLVQPQQLLHQPERDAGLGRLIDARELEVDVGAVVHRVEGGVLRLEIEDRAGRHRDDELVVKRVGHGLPYHPGSPAPPVAGRDQRAGDRVDGIHDVCPGRPHRGAVGHAKNGAPIQPTRRALGQSVLDLIERHQIPLPGRKAS